MQPCTLSLHTVLAIFIFSATAFCQVEEARQAIERREYRKAVEILSAAMTDRPTLDTFLYLGIAYAHLGEDERAEEIFREGIERYPNDPRFHSELAGLQLSNREEDLARSELKRALEIDPNSVYARDLLASIDLAQGDVESALKTWNAGGRPRIAEVLHNYFSISDSPVVRRSLAFRPGRILRHQQWKTTEARLVASRGFSNYGLELEPSPNADQYNAVIRTSDKTNDLGNMVFGLVKMLPIETSYFDVWNIGGPGTHWNSRYRWDDDRRLAGGRLTVPVPLPGLLFMDVAGTWRSERWDLSPTIRSEFRPSARFHYKSTGVRLNLKHIPHYRFEISGGLEYTNRAARGDISELAMDSRNTGKFHLGTQLRLADRRYKSQIRLEGFLARASVLGDFDYSGGTVEVNNRVVLARTTETILDFSVKGGRTNGNVPVEDYFVLGLELHPRNLLRGHTAADHGRYGGGPTGTEFVLLNTDIERKLSTMLLGNTGNIPFLKIKGEFFFDAAKVFDKNRIFRQGSWLLDAGAGLKFEAPTFAFNIVYGRSLRDGKGVMFGYVERRIW